MELSGVVIRWTIFCLGDTNNIEVAIAAGAIIYNQILL